MSFLKFATHLHLGIQEYNRLNKFTIDDGYRKHLLDNSYTFGIIRDVDDPNFFNYRIFLGTNPQTIKIDQDSWALDQDGLLIYKEAEDNISVPDDGNWYWVKISHVYSPVEKGLVTINANGELSGSGTEFTQTMRGLPNFPSKISFPTSNLNLGEYQVTNVIDDENAILAGQFQAESDLEYEVVGTFTPGQIPPAQNKYPFQYDSVNFELVQELVLNEPPAKIDGKEFYLARIMVDGQSVIIEDKRTEFWRTKASFDLFYMDKVENPLIGVESVRWDFPDFTPRDKNQVFVAWGFRSDNWSVETSLNRVTLSGGLGGKYKDVTFFQDGDFNGWRLYVKDGLYYNVVESLLVGNQINLTLDTLNIDEFVVGSQLLVVPNVERIHIKVGYDQASFQTGLIDNIYEFDISQGFAKIYLTPVASPTYSYNFQYRYRTFYDYSDFFVFPDDPVGFLSEQSFDDLGNPTIPVLKPYVGDPLNGFIELELNSEAYSNTFDWSKSVILGDADLGKNIGTYIVLAGGASVPDPTVGWLIEMHRANNNPTNSGIQVAHPFGPTTDRPILAVRFYNAAIDAFGAWITTATQDDIDNKVDVSGDTMTGDLVMSNSSIVVNDANEGINSDNLLVKTRRQNIGSWNMDINPFVIIPIPIGTSIIGAKIHVEIIDDGGVSSVSLVGGANNSQVDGYYVASNGQIVLSRVAAGFFDSALFDDAGVNRGYIWITYPA